jgi:hypothetical protein
MNNKCFYYEDRKDVCQALKEAWVELLSRYTWDWFCSFTFRGDILHPEKAGKKFSVLVAKINRTLYGQRYYKHGKSIRWVRAIEMQKRGVLHYHALLAGERLQELRRLTFMDEWDGLAGWARIEPLRSSQAVYRYVSKYVTKGGEIDIGGNFEQSGDRRQLFLEGLTTPEPGKGIQGSMSSHWPGQGLRAFPHSALAP